MSENWPLCLAALALVGICVCAYIDITEWHRYAEEHHCQRTGKRHSDIHLQCHHLGDNPCGMMLPVEHVQHEYACDGGEIRWR